jgi:prepilin-type N-terminal cleavage/methylation domain-containing protein
MRFIESRRAGGFTLLEVLVALVVAGLAMSAIVGVFGNSLAGNAVVSDAETALALAEERLALASAVAALRPGVDKGVFAGRFAWQTTVSRYVDGGDSKQTGQPNATELLYRIAVDIVWQDGRRSRQLALSTLRLEAAAP